MWTRKIITWRIQNHLNLFTYGYLTYKLHIYTHIYMQNRIIRHTMWFFISRGRSFHKVQLPLTFSQWQLHISEKNDPSKARVWLFVLLHCHFRLVLSNNSQFTDWFRLSLIFLKTELPALENINQIMCELNRPSSSQTVELALRETQLHYCSPKETDF